LVSPKLYFPNSTKLVMELGLVRFALVTGALQALLTVSESASKQSALEESFNGCCFSIGLGMMMRPCCLSTQPDVPPSSCNTGKRLGSSTGFVLERCPKDADEAAMWLNEPLSKSKAMKPLGGTIKAAALLQNASLQAAAGGCCYSIGYGSLMKPCCLTTHTVENESFCYAAKHAVMGGANSFSSDGCPSSAEQADKWIQAKSSKKALELQKAGSPRSSSASFAASSAINTHAGELSAPKAVLLLASVAGLAAAVVLVRAAHQQDRLEDGTFIRLVD